MIIIDANNLAGKLKLLKEKDFDIKLINIIKNAKINKRKKIILVFDSIDRMGDKYIEENITVIKTPRDNFYQNADDKIIEIIKNTNKSLILVTDDNNLIIKALKLSSTKVEIKKVKSFIKETLKYSTEEELEDQEKEKITKEFLNIWKQ